jgi:hypothetical protein
LKLPSEGEYPEWAAVALFYTALKLVDALLVQSGLTPPVDHEQRRDDVRSRFPSIWPAYRELEQISRGARYDLVRPSPFSLHQLQDRQLRQIVAFVERRGITLQPGRPE